MYKAMVSLGQGDFAGARSVMTGRPERGGSHTAGRALRQPVQTFYWVLNDTEQRVLLGLPPDAFDDDTAGWGLAQAQILWQRGRGSLWREGARVCRFRAHCHAGAASRLPAERGTAGAVWSFPWAYLGRKSDAVREGERSLVARRRSRWTRTIGPASSTSWLVFYILINEPEKALDLLEPLLGVPDPLLPGVAEDRSHLRSLAEPSSLSTAGGRKTESRLQAGGDTRPALGPGDCLCGLSFQGKCGTPTSAA